MAASLYRRSFLNFKNSLFHIQKRTGYVVLIPETPEEIAKCNIDSTENLPEFTKLAGSNIALIVNSLKQQYDVGSYELREILKSSRSQDIFKYVIEPLEVLSIPYWSAWGTATALHFSSHKLLPHNKFYPMSDEVLAARNLKYNSEELYNICKSELKNNGDNYSEDQKRILQKFTLEGYLNGFELNEDYRVGLTKVLMKIQFQTRTYDEKLKLSKHCFRQIIYDKNFVKDFPLDLVRCTSANNDKPLEGPWVLRLTPFIVSRYLEYCPSRDSRLHLWLSFNQLCSSVGDKRFNSRNEIISLLQGRDEYAKILGCKSYAHLALQNKMAESLEHVESVLEEILESAKHAQEKEIFELENFAYANGFENPLELWDFGYWKRRHLKEVMEIDENVLRNYFPLNQVLLGLIALCEELFGIVIEEQPSVEGWNPNVRYFRVSDEKTKRVLGGFYLDPYSQKYKAVGDYGSGWFVPMRSRSGVCNSTPLSALIFSFVPPEDDQPSLLYLRDILCLFEKFGQVMQHTLTEMKYSEVSGTANMEWDAVDIVPQFLCCWLHERGTLESISGHYETEEPLPSHILDNLSNYKKHMAGVPMCRQIYLSNLDLKMHSGIDVWNGIVSELWPKHFLFECHKLDSHPSGFQEILSGPWGAAYYSYVWAQMVAADIFGAFEEVGFNNQEEIKNLGRRFRSTFLALGGGCHPREVFQRFRGRKPDPKFLIKLLNFKKEIPLPKKKPETSLT